MTRTRRAVADMIKGGGPGPDQMAASAPLGVSTDPRIGLEWPSSGVSPETRTTGGSVSAPVGGSDRVSGSAWVDRSAWSSPTAWSAPSAPSAPSASSVSSVSSEPNHSWMPLYMSPTLVVLAALAILQGYRGLNVLPSVGWQPSAAVFAAVAAPLAVAVTITTTTAATTTGRSGNLRRQVMRPMAVAAALLVVVTVSALLASGPSVTRMMGAADLLFAVTALGTVLVNERRIRHDRRAVGRASH